MNINLNKRCRIEQKTGTNETTYGTEQVTWALVAVVWCNIQDVLPSRSEELNRGVSINTQPARWRARYRSDINSAMRILIDGNVYQIVSGTATLGNKEYIECMIERYST